MGLFRLFLACVVAYSHWWISALRVEDRQLLSGYILLGFNAGYAVMFFYVISGFLITYTLTHHYSDDRTEIFRFYRRRLIRIYSVYWPIVPLTLVLIPNAPALFLSASFIDQLTKVFILGQDWRVAFGSYPAPHFQATFRGLEPSWTLGAEMTFYLLAPWLMRSWKAALAILIASFTARAAFVIALGDVTSQPIWNYLFAGSTIGFFMLGHLTCRAANRLPSLKSPIIALVLLPPSLTIMTFDPWVGFDTPRFWLPMMGFVVALPALFEATKNSRVLNYLGELSFPVYLLHTPLLMLTYAWIVPTFAPYGGGVSTAVYFALLIVLAALFHHTLEPLAVHILSGKWLETGSALRRRFASIRKLSG